MREVLNRIGSPPAVHLYIKRIQAGVWAEEEEATGADRSHLDPRTAQRLRPPEIEVRHYHSQWAPQDHADYILERADTREG